MQNNFLAHHAIKGNRSSNRLDLLEASKCERIYAIYLVIHVQALVNYRGIR